MMHSPTVHSRTLGGAVPALLAAFSLIGAQAAMAARGEVRIPDNTVVKLKLDSHLNSQTAGRGDHFAAVLDNDDRSGFPEGTRFQGTVTEVQRYDKKRPGTLDVEFRTAYLPDGQKAQIDGRLASLADDDVRRTENGRLEARRNDGRKPDWKWAGYGAAGGAVLSALFGGNLLRGILIGGAGGAVYSYLNGKKGHKSKPHDVDLPRGTEFGMMLTQPVAFQDRDNYRYFERTAGYRGSERVTDRVVDRRSDEQLDDRGDSRGARAADSALINGHSVRFDTARPHKINGVAFFPLSRIADAANMSLDWRRGDRDFSLSTPDGRLEGRVGERELTRGGQQLTALQNAPVLEDGELFVPRDFLRQAGMNVRWNAGDNRWEIDTNR